MRSRAPSSSTPPPPRPGVTLRRELDQPELNVVDRQRLLGERVEPAHGLRRPSRVCAGGAGERERAAAMRDGHVERRLDLAQVRVERPAQVRERAIVERGQRDLLALASGCHAVAVFAVWIAPDLAPARRMQGTLALGQTPCRTTGAFSASSSIARHFGNVRSRGRRQARCALPRFASSARSALASARISARASAGIDRRRAQGAPPASLLACSRCRLRRNSGMSLPDLSSLQIERRSVAIELRRAATPAPDRRASLRCRAAAGRRSRSSRG